MAERMARLEKDCCVRGYHVYQTVWRAAIGESLDCVREHTNARDRYAVAVTRGGVIIGHIPRRISRVCSIFLRKGGTMQCVVVGGRRYSADLPQGGLEIPCRLHFEGKANELKKVKKHFKF